MGVWSPGIGVTHCELPWGCWEFNLGTLEEQSVLLTPEPCLQSQKQAFNGLTVFQGLLYLYLVGIFKMILRKVCVYVMYVWYSIYMGKYDTCIWKDQATEFYNEFITKKKSHLLNTMNTATSPQLS